MLSSTFDPSLGHVGFPCELSVAGEDHTDYSLLRQSTFRLTATSHTVSKDLTDVESIVGDAPLPLSPASSVTNTVANESEIVLLHNSPWSIADRSVRDSTPCPDGTQDKAEIGGDSDSGPRLISSSVPYSRNESNLQATSNGDVSPGPPTISILVHPSTSTTGLVNNSNSEEVPTSSFTRVLTKPELLPRSVPVPTIQNPSTPSRGSGKASALESLPPLTPTPSPPSFSMILHAATTQQPSINEHPNVKTESSASPSPSITDISTKLKTLDSQLKAAASLLQIHNTSLDTISARLNSLLSTCTVLAQARKSLLEKRKSLCQEIDANRAKIAETKTKAGSLQVKQEEVMLSRDSTQHRLDMLMDEKRKVNRVLEREKYEEALRAKFPDKGTRELAKQIGWRAATVPSKDGGERDLFGPQNEMSEDDEDCIVDDSPEWLNTANALIDGDENFDFQDLSGLQQGIEGLDRRFKQEDDQQSNSGQTMPVTNTKASIPPRTKIKVEPSRNMSPNPSPSRCSSPAEIQRGLSASDDDKLTTGEFTLEKLQAHFKAMKRHKQEAARMLRELRGLKRKDTGGQEGERGGGRGRGLGSREPG